MTIAPVLPAADVPTLDCRLWPHRRPVPPAPDALCTAALLDLSLAVAQADPRLAAIAAAIRAGFAPHVTVFGLKWAEGRLRWEFHFYDCDLRKRRAGLATLIAALEGLAEVRAPAPEDRIRFMFSVAFGCIDARGAPLEAADLYVGIPDSGVSAGMRLGLRQAGRGLKNLHHIFNAAARGADAHAKAFATARFDAPRLDPAGLFWPDVLPAETLVVANKRHCDGLFFARIGIDGMMAFLRRLVFPPALTEAIASRRSRLAHRLFDAGHDYEAQDGAVVRRKGSFRGLL